MNGDLGSSEKEEAESLLLELAEIKEVLRSTSNQLSRIERRVRAAFPIAAAKIPRTSGGTKAKRPPLNEGSIQAVIAELKDRITKGEQIEVQLRQYPVKPDLQLVARSLGMTNAKLPPKEELVKRISTRIRQSVSVASGFHEDPADYTSEKS